MNPRLPGNPISRLVTFLAGLADFSFPVLDNSNKTVSLYEATSDGARLLLVPKVPEQLPEFRTQIRTYVEHMQKGECPMKFEMMQDMMRTMKHSESAPADSLEPAGTDHSTHH